MSEEYRNLVKELSAEEKKEAKIHAEYEAKLRASQAKQTAIKLQLKALRYEGDGE